MRQFIYSIWEILEIIIIVGVSFFTIQKFIVQPFLVSGISMQHTFLDGDYVIVDELTYRLKEPSRGDVIVFRYPLDPKTYYIKRIIGIKGDRVVVNNGQVSVNGKVIEEGYLDEGLRTNLSADSFVGEGQVFVMGDNRPHSYDSRSWGMVPYDNIIGLVKVRLLPITHAKIFAKQIYKELES